MWSPAYAAPEVLEGGKNTPQSDLASLGYVLDRNARRPNPFDGMNDLKTLLDAKQDLDKRLKDFLPADVSCNELLLHLCQKLIAPDPAKRFRDAQAADLDRKGADRRQRRAARERAKAVAVKVRQYRVHPAAHVAAVEQVLGAQRAHQRVLHQIVGDVGVAGERARVATQRGDCRLDILAETGDSLCYPVVRPAARAVNHQDCGARDDGTANADSTGSYMAPTLR